MSATAPPAPPPAHPTRRQLETVNSVMLALTSAFVVARLAIRVTARRPFDVPDFFIYFAFALFVGMWVCLMLENVQLFRVESLQRGEIPLYPGVIHDAAMIYRYMTAAQICFYSSLLSVKLSLLTLYLRLLERTPAVYKKIWWGILVFCGLAWFGSLLSTLFVCDSNDAKYNRGACAQPHEIRRSIISLWFAYGVDVLSDLLVMLLPFKLTWNLQMPRTEKAGVFLLFGTGWILILFSTLRVAQVGLANGVPSTPDTKWLEMWTVIETSIAVIIGCSPAFAALVKNAVATITVSYNSRGYVKGSKDSAIKMKSVPSTSSGKPNNENFWGQEHGSTEELANTEGQIVVTTSIHQDNQPPPDVPKGYVRKLPTTIR